MKPSEELDLILSGMAGQTCWATTGCASTGWQIGLHFGGSVARDRESGGRFRNADLAQFDGEYIVFINSNWSFAVDGRPVHDEAPYGPDLEEAVETLVGCVLERASLKDDGLVLSLRGWSRAYTVVAWFERPNDFWILYGPSTYVEVARSGTCARYRVDD